MPKKFVGENSKAVAARARKSAAREEEAAKKQKQLEDEYWKDDNKHVVRKQQRKDEQVKKKQELQDKKAESKALAEKEMNSIQITKKQPITKITQAQIQSENEKRRLAALKSTVGGVTKTVETQEEAPLEENLNRLLPTACDARTVEDAIAVLNVKETEVDRHPEKRMKAAYAVFEETHLPQLKAENPSLRLTQLKQMLFKEWTKSPENPMNQTLS